MAHHYDLLVLTNSHRLACCHERSNLYHDGKGHGVDDGGWSQKFEIHVLEIPEKAKIKVPQSDGIDHHDSEQQVEEANSVAAGEDGKGGNDRGTNFFKDDNEIPIPNMLTKAKKSEFMKK